MVLTLTAKDALNQRYKTVQNEDTLNQAVSLFDGETDVLFVFDNEKYKGSLTNRSIIRSGLKDIMKVKRLVYHAPKIQKKTPLTECARLMIENDVMQLPVFQDNEIIGVVSAESLLEAAALKLFGNNKTGDLMSEDIIVCSPEDTLYSIVMLFRNHHISRLPVVSNNSIIGVVSMHDIVQKAISMDKEVDIFATVDEKTAFYNVPVENIMTPSVETAYATDDIRNVIKTMTEYCIGGVVVVDDKKLPIGMLTKRDILEHIIKLQENVLPVNIQISSKVKKIDKNEVKKEFENYISKNREEFGVGHLYIYLSEISSKKTPIIQCRLRLNTDKIRINVKAEGNSEKESVKKCLNRLKNRFRKEKQKK